MLKFDQLTDSQKQIIAEKWCYKVGHFRSETHLVEYVLDKSQEDVNTPFSSDDITNFESYGVIEINGYQCELTESERDEKLEFYEYLRDKAEIIQNDLIDLERDNCADKIEKLVYKYDSICDALKYMDFDEQPEIMEWFHCSSDACRKLERAGQCTLDGSFWGRQCYGQAIYLDYVIQRIAFDYYCEYGKDYISEETIINEGWRNCAFWGA